MHHFTQPRQNHRKGFNGEVNPGPANPVNPLHRCNDNWTSAEALRKTLETSGYVHALTVERTEPCIKAVPAEPLEQNEPCIKDVPAELNNGSGDVHALTLERTLHQRRARRTFRP